MSPVAVSDRALERIANRTHPVPYAIDLSAAAQVLGQAAAGLSPHHARARVYALHEALREVAVEGLAARWERHMEAGRSSRTRSASRGLELLAEPEHQLPQLTAVRVPEGVDGKAGPTALLHEHGIEIGGGLGPARPRCGASG